MFSSLPNLFSPSTIFASFLLLCSFLHIDAGSDIVNIDQLLPARYDAQKRPTSTLGATELHIEMVVDNLIASDEIEQSITLDLWLAVEWNDARIVRSNITSDLIISESSMINRFWTPELYFVNGLSITVVNSFRPIRRLMITSGGAMRLEQRLNARLGCYMNLQNFPHDHQYCPIILSTLVYNTSEVTLLWRKFHAYDHENSRFRISFFFSYGCQSWQTPTPENSCLVGTLKLVRRLAFYIIRQYSLSFLCVIVSFGGFWIPVLGWPARITIIIIPLLNIITMDISLNNDIGVNYVTSIHWWFMWIQAFVYLDLVEYVACIAWAHFVVDKKKYLKTYQAAIANKEGGVSTIQAIDMPPKLPGYWYGNDGAYQAIGHFFDRFCYFFFGPVDFWKEPYMRNKVDYCARILYPFIFIVFTFIYCVVCFISWSTNYYEYYNG